jgi:hypothetical protein
MHETHTNAANEMQIVRNSSSRSGEASGAADHGRKPEVYLQVGRGFD